MVKIEDYADRLEASRIFDAEDLLKSYLRSGRINHAEVIRLVPFGLPARYDVDVYDVTVRLRHDYGEDLFTYLNMFPREVGDE